ncbi:arsenate reductase ArsC [Roseobacteraceae bacterium S113]
MNILVLCTGNSARSILLEAILNASGKGRISAFSAGSKPAGKVHPQSLVQLNRLGYDTRNASSKSWDVFAGPDAPVMDAVITVCGSAAGETCPVWPGAPVRVHWGVDDPAKAPEPEWETAFQTAYERLAKRAAAFVALPFDTMAPDTLRAAMTRIGEI